MTTLDKAGVEAALDAVPPGCLCSVRTMIEPNHNAEKLISASILAYLSTLSAEPAPADVAEMVKGLTDLGAWLDIDFGSDEPAGNFARSAASLLTRVAAARDEWKNQAHILRDKLQAQEIATGEQYTRATAAEAALAEATAYAERLACALEWEPLSGDLKVQLYCRMGPDQRPALPLRLRGRLERG